MAEVVGFTASILTLVQVTATVASFSYSYIVGIKKAPENIQKLIDGLKSFAAALTIIKIGIKDDTFESSIELQAQVHEPLQRCLVEMRKLEDRLDPKTKKGIGRWRGAVVRAQWPFEEKETLEFIEKIERYKTLFTLLLGTSQLYHTAAIEKAVTDLNTDVQVLTQAVSALTSPPQLHVSHNSGPPQSNIKSEEFIKECIEVLQTLHPGSFDKRHVEISRRRKLDTGEWILGTPEIKRWYLGEKGSPRLLWGFGIPGAGKTFISSFLIDHLKSQAKATNCGVAYIYFNYKEQDRQLSKDVLASLIKQLACQLSQSELPIELKNLRKRLVIDQETPTPEDLYPVLLALAKMFTRTFIICDALDECDPQTQRRDLLSLFHRMSKDMNLFITSREYPEDIQHSFQDSAKIELAAKDKDIARYIEQKITDNPRAERLVGEEVDCRRKIIGSLQRCSKGMFLLVHFHIEYLCKQTTRRQILEELERLDNSSHRSEINPIDPTYDRALEILKAQPKNCVDLAFKVFLWLVKSRRVLSVRELQLAVSTKRDSTVFDESDIPDRKTLLDVCSSLVTIDKEQDTVRLVHYTAQEYLLRKSLLPKDTNLSVAATCISFLSLDIFVNIPACNPGELESLKRLYPFLKYCADFAGHHLTDCDEHLVVDMVVRFLRSLSHLSYLWVKYIRGAYPPRGDLYVLHAAASLGNRTAVQMFIKRDIDITNFLNETPFIIAICEGHLLVAELLLDKGANISAADKHGRTALMFASREGYKETVMLLLNRGADISATEKDGRTTLIIASGYGHKETVVLLLDRGADISAADTNGWTALITASSQGHKEVVMLLLDRGADISVTGKDGRSALIAASSQGHKEVVMLLLDRGADISVTGKDGGTALIMASFQGYKETIMLLLDRGADISAADTNGWTALIAASSQGHKEVVMLLLDRGADISAADTNGWTALITASIRGHKETVMLLLDRGADISAADTNGWTALIMASSHGNKETVILLLDRGADISAADTNGWTALITASIRGNKETVILLLDRGADISATEKNWQTALMMASSQGHKEVAMLLCERWRRLTS